MEQDFVGTKRGPEGRQDRIVGRVVLNFKTVQ